MTDLLLNPIAAVLFYGAFTFIILALCELSGKQSLARTAEWLTVAWIGSNIIFAWLSASHAPWLVPSYNAAIAVMVASVAIRYRCNTAWWVVRLYCLEFAFVVGMFVVHEQGSVPYYATLNLIFLGRMVILGEAGYVELADRIHRRNFGARHRLARVAANRKV